MHLAKPSLIKKRSHPSWKDVSKRICTISSVGKGSAVFNWRAAERRLFLVKLSPNLQLRSLLLSSGLWSLFLFALQLQIWGFCCCVWFYCVFCGAVFCFCFFFPLGFFGWFCLAFVVGFFFVCGFVFFLGFVFWVFLPFIVIWHFLM